MISCLGCMLILFKYLEQMFNTAILRIKIPFKLLQDSELALEVRSRELAYNYRKSSCATL